MNKQWKHAERRVAEFFFSRRTPLSGSNSGHDTQADTLSKVFYVETKYRAKSPMFQLCWDTMRKARAEGKVPVVALVPHKLQGFIIATHVDHFEELARTYLRELELHKAKNHERRKLPDHLRRPARIASRPVRTGHA